MPNPERSIDIQRDSRAEQLPMSALLALAMTGFICILTETLPAGLLPLLAEGLHVSQPLAGQTVTAYALGSLIAAIPLTIATRRWPRRNVLLLTIVGFLLFNSVTALSSSYTLTLIARFFAGVSAGLAWSLIAGYARRMVEPHQQGRALAVAMAGTPVALSLGVPLSTWLGNIVGWRVAFGIMSFLTLVLIGWVIARVPNYPGQTSAQSLALRKVAATPGVVGVLAVVATWMLGHNVLYTYVAPLVSLAGLSLHVDVVLLVFGIAALIGIWITGKIVDGHLRKAVLCSLAGFAGIALAFGLWPRQPIIIYLGIAIWGLSFGGAATLLQTALADAAGPGADAALSMNVVVWNSAIAGGGLLGGALLDHIGAGSFSWVVMIFALVSLGIAFFGRSHAFPAGHRQHGHVEQP